MGGGGWLGVGACPRPGGPGGRGPDGQGRAAGPAVCRGAAVSCGRTGFGPTAPLPTQRAAAAAASSGCATWQRLRQRAAAGWCAALPCQPCAPAQGGRPASPPPSGVPPPLLCGAPAPGPRGGPLWQRQPLACGTQQGGAAGGTVACSSGSEPVALYARTHKHCCAPRTRCCLRCSSSSSARRPGWGSGARGEGAGRAGRRRAGRAAASALVLQLHPRTRLPLKGRSGAVCVCTRVCLGSAACAGPQSAARDAAFAHNDG